MLIDKEEFDIELENIKQCHINIDKLLKTCYINNKLTSGITRSQRAKLLLVETDLERLKELACGDEMLERVVKRVKEINENEALMEGLWDYEEDQRKIWNTKLCNAEEEGMEKGMKKGMEKGIKQGTLKAALNMLKKNLDKNLISECTGLTIAEINNLKI